ncbi:YihY/virulence factor BrkB family protein [Salinirubellus salinus]|uniref:YihY/virulence factor BrkB family protein n=1 Tax=Salinirubellus salinus TaxID=1364945 RepID=A0A9E7U9H7_9EURY|nr:YihY/virulence factor BrkB family protein [Salinirubellus salinus]UWM52849.1 YihY/virulence factor BrkB family protein [Salinirubellus salinus]
MSFPQEERRQRPSGPDLIRATVEAVRSDQITFIAASLAYYAFISLLPLLLLGIVAAGVFGGEELALRLATEASGAFGEEAGTLVRETLTDTSAQAGASVVGVVFLGWSGLKLFRGLSVAFATVYGGSTEASFLVQLRDAIVALLAVGLGVSVTVAVGLALALLESELLGMDIDFIATLGTPLLVGGLTAAFLPLYYLLPGVDISVGEALPGALLAAAGWTFLQFGFRLYAGVASAAQVYGVLGAVLLIVTFLYFGGLILLVGVVFNAVLAGRLDRDDIEADMEAIDKTARTMTDDNDAGGVTGGEPSPGPGDGDGGGPGGPSGGGDNFSDEFDGDVEAELERLYDELDRFEEEFDDRIVHREEIERELKRYVRGRVRRGKARGWGPYLVLLYGTAMTIGAFVYLSGGWAILAMLVIWLSTLGLYVLMLIVGGAVGVAGLPGRLSDRFGAFRD